MIKGKINVLKIDKSRLFEGKAGAKYLDFVLIETPDGQYGNDYMIVQEVTREERAKGVRGAIIGNAKIAGSQPKSPPKDAEGKPPEDDDVPF